MTRLHRWPIFICYRRVDGTATARRLHEVLAAYRVEASDGSRIELDPYLDENMPGVADWKRLHRPYLEKARALIIVCTPGVRIDEGEGDWVHREIDWWIANRSEAPILVDPLMEGIRFVPLQIVAKWPDIQRISLPEAEWRELSGPDLTQKTEAIRRRVIGAILPSGAAIYEEELEKERARVVELEEARNIERDAKRRARRMLRVAVGLLAGVLVLGVLAGLAAYRSKTSEAVARASLLDAEAAAEFQNSRQIVAGRAVDIGRRMDLLAQVSAGTPPPAAPADLSSPPGALSEPGPGEDEGEAPPRPPEGAPVAPARSPEEQSYRLGNLHDEVAQLDKEIEAATGKAREARERGAGLLGEADDAWSAVAARWFADAPRRARPEEPRIFSVEVLNAGDGESVLIHYGPIDTPRLILVNTGDRPGYRETLRPRLQELSLRQIGGKPVRLELIAIGDQDVQKTGGLMELLRDVAEPAGGAKPPAEIGLIWANIFRYRGGDEGQFRNQIRVLIEALKLPLNRPFDHFVTRPPKGQLVHRLPGGMRIAILGPARGDLTPLFGFTQGEALRRGSRIEQFPKETFAGFDPAAQAIGLAPVRTGAPRPTACVPSARARRLAGGSYRDPSIPNRASTILLFEYAGKTFLHPGDARGDLVIGGLAAAGLLDQQGRAHVDLMTIPHFGSESSVGLDFFRRIRASTYLITGNGRFDNPDISVMASLVAARGCERYDMLFATRERISRRHSRDKSLPPETLDSFFAAERRNNPNYRRLFRSPERGSIFWHLREPLP